MEEEEDSADDDDDDSSKPYTIIFKPNDTKFQRSALALMNLNDMNLSIYKNNFNIK